MKIEDSVIAVATAISQGRGEALTEGEIGDIRLWHQGRALMTIQNTEAYQLIHDMLQSYGIHEMEDLMATPPEDKKRVTSLHATSYALNALYKRFKADAERMLASAKSMPDVMRESAKQILNNPQNGQV